MVQYDFPTYARTDRRTDGPTDGRTDGRTWKQNTPPPPPPTHTHTHTHKHSLRRYNQLCFFHYAKYFFLKFQNYELSLWWFILNLCGFVVVTTHTPRCESYTLLLVLMLLFLFSVLFSIVITSLFLFQSTRNASRTFASLLLPVFLSLPRGVMSWLRLVIVALPGLFI